MATDQAVCTVATADEVIIDTTVHSVIAQTTNNRVGVVTGRDNVIACATINRVTSVVGVRVAGEGRATECQRERQVVVFVIRERVDASSDRIVAVATQNGVRTLNIRAAVSDSSSAMRVLSSKILSSRDFSIPLAWLASC